MIAWQSVLPLTRANHRGYQPFFSDDQNGAALQSRKAMLRSDPRDLLQIPD
jgi:hypothetical protein